MKVLINILMFLFAFLATGIVMTSCTRRDLDAFEIQEADVDIHFDWSLLVSEDTLPQDMKLFFYGNDTLIEKDVTNEGFQGTLPIGTYQILTHNIDSEHINYKDMDDYSQASVYVPELTKATSYYYQPLHCYGTGLDEFSVVSSTVNRATMKILPLVKKATLKFSLTGNASAVSSCYCTLSGISQSMQIAHAETGGEEGAIEFSPLPAIGGYESTISFLGRTQSSINTLSVILYFKAGGSQTLEVDITSALSKVDIYNPWIVIKLSIDITGSVEGVFKATLKDWTVEKREIIVV